MHHSRNDRQSPTDEGFTLIELLVVIIIIGILSAIAIPAYLSQKQKATEASIKSDLQTMAIEMESYESDYESYPLSLNGTSLTGNPAIGTETAHLSSGNSILVNFDANGSAYCLVGSNPHAGKTWYYISTDGGLQPAGTSSCGTY